MTRTIHRTIVAAAAAFASISCTANDDTPPTGPSASGPALQKPVAPTPSIAIVKLPTLGSRSVAHAINDAQEIAGTSGSFPARWTRTGSGWAVQKLGAGTGSAEDINEAGTAVGSSNGLIMLWRRDGSSALVGQGWPVALNESEIVVGVERPSGHATAWVRVGEAWIAHYLPRLAGVTEGVNEPSGINDDGVIVGYSYDETGTQHAVKWRPSTAAPGEWDAAVPLDAHAAATNSAATGIEGSDVVGLVFRCTTPTVFATCTTRDPYHWALNGLSAFQSLGTEDAWPEGLNSSRFIVGVYFTSSRAAWTSHGFVWSPGAPTIQNLGTLKGYSDGWAEDVNNSSATRASKQIVGSVSNKSGQTAAVVWIVP